MLIIYQLDVSQSTYTKQTLEICTAVFWTLLDDLYKKK